jgi:hypothetical protein
MSVPSRICCLIRPAPQRCAVLWSALLWAVPAALLPAPARCTTLLDVPNGTPVDGFTARSGAMGGAGVAVFQGSAALVQNPAALALTDSTVRADLVLGLWHASENRFVPLYDSFQSFATESAIAINSHSYTDAQGGVVYRIPHRRAMAVGLGLFQRFDFDYDYFEEFRDPSPFSQIRDTIQDLRQLQVRGRLLSLTGGYGAELGAGAHVGLSVHRYFGTIEQDRRIAGFHAPPDSVQSLKHDLAGWGVSLGGLMRVNDRLDLGIDYEHRFSVKGTLATDTTSVRSSGTSVTHASVPDVELEYPGTLRLGVAYRPRNELRTVFTVEAVRRFWSAVATNYRRALVSLPATPDFRDTWDVRMGVEHIFYNGTPLRAGFRYLENYSDRESSRSIFSAGFGVPVAGFMMDVTGQFQRQTSRQPLGILFDPTTTVGGDTFPAPAYDAKVDDSVVRMVVGISRGF